MTDTHAAVVARLLSFREATTEVNAFLKAGDWVEQIESLANNAAHEIEAILQADQSKEAECEGAERMKREND